MDDLSIPLIAIGKVLGVFTLCYGLLVLAAEGVAWCVSRWESRSSPSDSSSGR